MFNLNDSLISIDGCGESIQDNEGENTLEFGAGISIGDIVLNQYADGVVRLQYSEQDSLNLLDGLSGGVQTLKFSSGTAFSLQDFYANQAQDAVDMSSSEAGASLVGSAAANQLVATGGGPRCAVVTVTMY